MACCGGDRHARSYLIASNQPDYDYQRVYVSPCDKCRKCAKRKMQWRGIRPDGTLSDFYTVDDGAYAQWLRRIEVETAKPSYQFHSDWTLKSARPADIAAFYHRTIEAAQS